MSSPHDNLMDWLSNVAFRARQSATDFLNPEAKVERQSRDIQAQNRESLLNDARARGSDLWRYYLPQQEAGPTPYYQEGNKHYTWNPSTHAYDVVEALDMGPAELGDPSQAGIVTGPNRFKLGQLIKQIEKLGLKAGDQIDEIKALAKGDKIQEATTLAERLMYRLKLDDGLRKIAYDPPEGMHLDAWEGAFEQAMGRAPLADEFEEIWGTRNLPQRVMLENRLKYWAIEEMENTPEHLREKKFAELQEWAAETMMEFDEAWKKAFTEHTIRTETARIQPDAVPKDFVPTPPQGNLRAAGSEPEVITPQNLLGSRPEPKALPPKEPDYFFPEVPQGGPNKNRVAFAKYKTESDLPGAPESYNDIPKFRKEDFASDDMYFRSIKKWIKELGEREVAKGQGYMDLGEDEFEFLDTLKFKGYLEDYLGSLRHDPDEMKRVEKLIREMYPDDLDIKEMLDGPPEYWD